MEEMRQAHNNKPKSRFWVLLAILLFGGLFINWFEARGEASVQRQALAEFPLRMSDWKQKGDEYRFGEATESVLKTTDYTARRYEAPDGRRWIFTSVIIRRSGRARPTTARKTACPARDG